MELDELIETASSNRPLAVADVEATARQLGQAVPDLVDLFARTVATRYLRGDYSFAHADMAMNQLFGFAHAVSGMGLPEFAWHVFGAFDEGEYLHDGEPLARQGEARTRELLGRIGLLSGA